MNALFDLHGRVAAVTGANTGLGQGIAVGLAQAGSDIIAIGRSEPLVTGEQVAALGRRFAWVQAELGAGAEHSDIVERAWQAFGGIDVLVNNAGTIRRADAIDFTETAWDEVVDVNLKSVFFLSQAMARRWLTAGRGGKIIQIASLLSFQGGIRVASYTASKSGLLGLTRLLANEWAGQGIHVNAIVPGYFSTSNTQALREDPERNQAILARIPAGRWGQPSDLAGAAVFLASPASDYVHGSAIAVDGGWLAR